MYVARNRWQKNTQDKPNLEQEVQYLIPLFLGIANEQPGTSLGRMEEIQM